MSCPSSQYPETGSEMCSVLSEAFSSRQLQFAIPLDGVGLLTMWSQLDVMCFLPRAASTRV